MFWRSLTFFLLETGSVITHRWWQAQGCWLLPPNFSCIQNDYKYVEVYLMLFPNIRKCHEDLTRSESGDDPHNSVRKSSWSARKWRCTLNSWEVLSYAGNKAKMSTYRFIKHFKYPQKAKTKQKQQQNKFAKMIFLKGGGNRNPGVPTPCLSNSVQQPDTSYWTPDWKNCSFLLRDFYCVYYKCTFIGSK